MPTDGSPEAAPDLWADWVLRRRHGGDAAIRARRLRELDTVRDAVLDRLELRPGQALLDVGSGDGLVGLGALPRVGATGEVIFSDISADLIDACRAAADRLGMAARCRFVVARAEQLTGVADASVDAVASRAVLIYVEDKRAAFAEFYRVLRPGGRISLHEPINRLMFPEPPEEFFWGYPVGPLGDLAALLKADDQCSEAESTLVDFDERDLFAFAVETGFAELHLELHRQATQAREPMPWETFLASSPNPLARSNGELIEARLTPRQRSRLEAHLRAVVEKGQRTHRLAIARLWAQKPG
ncbi:MAG: class I SAM-dependent methyltransferase [Candidatus Dormibacteria bacterium]